jgi:hypothetical protein
MIEPGQMWALYYAEHGATDIFVILSGNGDLAYALCLSSTDDEVEVGSVHPLRNFKEEDGNYVATLLDPKEMRIQWP